MNKDIRALIAIYTILILIGWNLELRHKINKENESKFEAMKFALELNKANNTYISMLNSMNEYADELQHEVEVMEEQNQLIKDLRFSR